jgi:hypothetical protein
MPRPGLLRLSKFIGGPLDGLLCLTDDSVRMYSEILNSKDGRSLEATYVRSRKKPTFERYRLASNIAILSHVTVYTFRGFEDGSDREPKVSRSDRKG